MKNLNFLVLLTISLNGFPTHAETRKPDFSTGIIGTSFVSNGGSTTYEYKVLIDFRVHGRHTVELKFVERNNYDERNLAKKEDEETVMVNCTRHSYTTSLWLAENNSNYGYKQYKNGDAVSWSDKSDMAYANYGNGWQLPIYLKMVCDSL